MIGLLNLDPPLLVSSAEVDETFPIRPLEFPLVFSLYSLASGDYQLEVRVRFETKLRIGQLEDVLTVAA